MRTLLFAIKFAALFAIFMGTFEAVRGSASERFVVETLILEPVTAAIHLINPQDQVRLVGRSIISTGSKLNVTRGCEGVEIFLLLCAAILAFPASWRARAEGLAWGFLLSYALSFARLIGLHFTLRYWPAAWESLHGFVFPLAPIFLIMLYFMNWTGRRGLPQSQPAVPHVA
jgi:exosortase family protein XrtM